MTAELVKSLAGACLAQKFHMSYHDVLVTCSEDKVLLVYSRNCSLFPQKNCSSYHLRRILPSNQTKVFHSFSFSLFKANEGFLIGLKSCISGVFFYVLCFRRQFWDLWITSTLLSGLTYQLASLWGLSTGTSRKTISFGHRSEC